MTEPFALSMSSIESNRCPVLESALDLVKEFQQRWQ